MAPGRGPRGPVPKIKNPGQLLSRLMKFIFSRYLLHYVVVLICIFTSVFCSVQGTLFMQTLIDDYIAPFVGSGVLDTQALFIALCKVGSFFALGVVCAYSYNRIMINISQGTLKVIRDVMFVHMQTLPIGYFDSHTYL